MPTFFTCRPGLLPLGVMGLLCGLLCSCVSLGKKDAFPVAGKPLGLPAAQALADRNGTVCLLPVSIAGRQVAAYYLRHPASRGVLLFVGGSGNQVDAALKGFGTRTAALGLDLVAFSYYQQGEPIPMVAEVRADTRAVYEAIKATGTRASRSVYVLGHSLGGWFALDLASSASVQGLVLAGAETTPTEVIRRTSFPWATLVSIRPDEDARQLDAALYAPHVRTRTLVVTSQQDEAVPVAVGKEVYAMIPAATPKRLVVLEGVTHGRYFLSDEFWRQFADFFGLVPVKEN